MTMPTPGLPSPVAAALDQVEAELPDADTGSLDQTLVDDVIAYLTPRRLDPTAQALLSRPKIFGWCLSEAVGRTDPESPLYRTAEPLSAERTETSKPRRTRGAAKEKKS